MSDSTDGQSRLETAVWLVVFLIPIAGLVWEFGTGMLAAYPPSDNLPLYFIQRLEVVMYTFVIVLGGGTLLAYVYAAIRYSDDGERSPKLMPVRWRQGTFLTWLAIVIVALLVTGIAGGATLLQVDSGSPPTESMGNQYDTQGQLTYKVVGVQWTWMAGAKHLPAMQRRIIRMPANTTIHLRITSKDVIHSFAIQELGVKKDAVPGQFNHYYFAVREPGEYQINCAELCGAGHSQMTPTLVVMPRTEYAQWALEQGGTNPFENGQAANVTAQNASNTSNPNAKIGPEIQVPRRSSGSNGGVVDGQ